MLVKKNFDLATESEPAGLPTRISEKNVMSVSPQLFVPRISFLSNFFSTSIFFCHPLPSFLSFFLPVPFLFIQGIIETKKKKETTLQILCFVAGYLLYFLRLMSRTKNEVVESTYEERIQVEPDLTFNK